MTEYRVVVGKEALVFAAAHFITFGDGGCESLHGHNYRVGVTLWGDLDSHSMVYDFIALKRDMQYLLDELDHRVLLPASNSDLDLVISAGQVEIRHEAQRWVFPESDAVVLPIPNTTADQIARYLGGRLAEGMRLARADALDRIEVEVEEAPGQSAFWSGRLGT